MARRRAKKKHRGFKDPYQQMENRLNKIKHKINKKPANEESQEISRKLKSIMDYQIGKKNKVSNQKDKEDPKKKNVNDIKKNKKKLRRSDGDGLLDTAMFYNRDATQFGMKRSLKKVPRLLQYSDETDEEFLKRVAKATSAVLQESKYEKEFGVDVERDEDGKINVKRRKLLDDPTISDKLRTKLQGRHDIKKEKKKERDWKRKHRNKKDEDVDEFSYFQDKVQFGDVVYEPPNLDTSRFKKLNGGETKTKTFLFMEKLKSSQAEKIPEATVSRKRILEEERIKAVLAYRAMKAAKYGAHGSLSVG